MAGDRRYSARYSLDSADGIRLLLGELHALEGRQFQGDTDAIIILADLQTAIQRAGLTERQLEALRLVFVEDLTQKAAGERMGVTRQQISNHVSLALTKIAEIYESWAWMDEGYHLTYQHRIENAWSSTVVKNPAGYHFEIKHGKRRTIR